VIVIAIATAAGALAYGRLAGIPPGPTVGYFAFLQNVKAGEVASVIDFGTTFTVVDRQGHTYEVVPIRPPTLNVTDLSEIQGAAAAGGHTFDPANFHEGTTPDTGWIGPYVVGATLLVLAAGYILLFTGPEPIRDEE
jgi:hypothetical protein